MPSSAMQRMLLASFDFYVVYRMIVVVSLAKLLHYMISRPKKRTIFPFWATIELALTIYIVRKGGLGQRA